MKLKLIAVITTNGIMICRAVSLLPRGLWVKVVFKKCLTLRTDDFLAALMVNNTIPIKYKYHVGLIARGASLLGKDEISSIGGRTSPGVRCHTIVTVTAYSTFWEMEMIVFYTFINRLFLIYKTRRIYTWEGRGYVTSYQDLSLSCNTFSPKNSWSSC